MTTQSQIRDRVNPMLFANQTSLIDYIKDFLQANGDRNIENISREYENSEVMERWLVDSRLCKQLADRGQPILETGYETRWGRTCTGQSVYMDSVIQEIFFDSMM